jgi:AcrR family transcriptional regulator
MSPTKLEWVRQPQQQRSQQTLERLLDAAEAIIAEHGVDNASVAEIAKRAESSIGAFYTRFHDKEGLLRCLFVRFGEQAEATADAALDVKRWEGVPLRDALETMMRFMIMVLHERRGLIAAMLARFASDPSLGTLGDRLLDKIAGLLLALIRARGLEGSHRDLEKGVHMAVWMVLSALELRAVYSLNAKPRHPDADVATELAECCLRYLGVHEPAIHPTQPAARIARREKRARPRV